MARSRTTKEKPAPTQPAAAVESPDYWIYGCLALLTVVVFVAVGHYDFIRLDDSDYVSHNPHIAGGLTWSSFVWAWTTGYAANWHPLTWISHMLDIEIFGLAPGGHHIVNLLIHIANTLLLFHLLRKTTQAPWPSMFVAA